MGVGGQRQGARWQCWLRPRKQEGFAYVRPQGVCGSNGKGSWGDQSWARSSGQRGLWDPQPPAACGEGLRGPPRAPISLHVCPRNLAASGGRHPCPD